MTQTPKRFKTGSSVMMPAGVIQEISDIQYVHNRYQLKGISGWRYGIDQLRRVNWKAEAEKWRAEAMRQYPTPEAYEAACAARDKYQASADTADKTIKELVEIIEYEADLADLRGAEIHARELRAMVATLYPDTPAPTPDYIDVKFPKAINEAWAFIKGDGSFTGPQLKQWTNDLGPALSQQILRVLIQTIWADYGGKATQVDTPEITARPIDEWHEDYGDVLWWMFPIQEPPYCGTPLDSSWSDDYTHWTPFLYPDDPALKEGK